MVDYAKRWKESPRGVELADQARFRAVCQAIIDGEITKVTLRKHRLAYATYSRVKAELEKAGVIEPFADRFRRATAHAAESALEELTERINSGGLEDRSLSISFGILADKVQANAPQEVVHTVNVSLSPDSLASRLISIDSGLPGEALSVNDLAKTDTVIDATFEVEPEPDARQLEVHKRAEDQAKKGGRGVKKRGGG